ncbi:MAG: hypothetical protein HY903_12020 [Deltaproteobacteria bacterium]|nr:hypothetical protein [Deltaproteobacteria bacterium]
MTRESRRFASRRRGSLLGAGVLALVGAGCGSEARLVVQLTDMASDDPWSGVARLQLAVRHNDNTETLTTPWPVPGDRTLEFEAVRRTGTLAISARGEDAAGVVLSEGAATPTLPERDGKCCVYLCFCGAAFFAAGTCVCPDADNACHSGC